MGWLKRWLNGGRSTTDRRIEYEAQVLESGWVPPAGAGSVPSSGATPGRIPGAVSAAAHDRHDDLLERVYRHQDC